MTVAVRRTLDSLTVPNYRRYFAGQIVSITGNWMQLVAEAWLVLKLTGSGVSVGITRISSVAAIFTGRSAMLSGW